MILKELKKTIEKQKRKNLFIHPFYEKYCFSNIPATIMELFKIQPGKPTLPNELFRGIDSDNFNKVIILLIDGFGYQQWLECYRRYEFFNLISEKGIVSPLTTVFPSTTAATLTTINTGLTPQEHALLEWHVYFKEIDMIIKTLPFTTLDGKRLDRLTKNEVNKKILYEGDTIHRTFKKANVKSFSFVKASYAYSCYSKIVHNYSEIIPFLTFSDLTIKLRKLFESEKGQAYFYIYVDDLDVIEHLHGLYTQEYFTTLSELSYHFTKEVFKKTKKEKAKEAIFIVTSDHGQIEASPNDTIYLNKYKELKEALQEGRKGKPILPTGSPRDVFIHVKPEKIEKTLCFLSDKLDSKAKVMTTNEAIKLGLFGTGKLKKRFLDRVGDILILPYKNNTIWYEHIKGEKVQLLSYHGGLSESEMLVPFAITKFSELL